MATTTNYGWTTPDDTSLVKDGAAAIRTLGSSVDTTTKALNPSTTLGDIEYRSATANTNTRLGIGSTGDVLTVAGGVPSWAAPAPGGGMTLLASGSLSGAELNLTSISGSYKDLVIYLRDVYPSADDYIRLEANDTPNVYFSVNVLTGSINAMTSAAMSITLEMDNRDANNFVEIKISDYTNSVNKVIESRYMMGDPGGNFNIGGQIGTARIAAAITKIDLFFLSGATFSGGSYLLYGVS